jgi:hypothetical protein
MKRENFLDKIHNFLYENKENMNDFEYMFTQDTVLSIVIEGNNIKKNLLLFQAKIEEIFETEIVDIDTLKLRDLILNTEGIQQNYNGENCLSLNYNSLYDFLVDNNNFVNFENKKSLVFRIETEEQLGMYQYFIKKEIAITKVFDNNSTRQPSPMEDSYLKSLFGIASGGNFRNHSKEWIFGFKDKNMLKNWVESEEGFVDYIIDNSNGDIKVSTYEVFEKDTLNTLKQSCFKNKNVKLLNQLTFKDFMKSENLELQKILEKKIKKHSNDKTKVNKRKMD